jgi:Ca2+-binding EF-hand superfamily protein
MKRLIFTSLLLSGALIAGMGYNMPSFSDFDTDGNGQLTQKEFESTQQKRMTQKAEEGRMMRNAKNAPAFKDLDQNGDGKIDASEFKNHQNQQRANMGKGQGAKK